jgi:sugar-specific transcriptional regulator TrmB
MTSTKLNSGRIYEILDNLQSKGFISKTTKNKVKYFSATPPTILQDYIKNKEKNIEKQKQEINTLLPELMLKYSKESNDTEIQIFTGKQGMKSSYEILFQEAKKDKNLYITGTSQQFEYNKWLPTLMNTYAYPTRKRLKLKTKKLMNLKAKKQKLPKTDNSQIKYTNLDSLTSYEILGNVVIIQILQGETIHLVINSKQVAQDFKKQFLLLWNSSQK